MFAQLHEAARRCNERVGIEAGFPWKVHPHQLRHGCGYKLANDVRDTRTIQDYLGHRSIQSTVRYPELASVRLSAYSGTGVLK